MLYCLGCDVSKRKLDFSLVNEQGIEQWHGQAANEASAITAMLHDLVHKYANVELRCAVESTGCYHRLFAETVYGLNVPCFVYNPIITKQQLRSTIRGKKTDRTDALMIARIGLRGEGRPYTPEPYPVTKYYARGSQRLAQFGVGLEAYQTHLENSGVALSSESRDAIRDARRSFLAAKKRFRQELVATAPSELVALLQSIPGVGPFIAASLVGEIQDMTRFRTSKQLVAYAGLDPKIKQSGHTLNSTGRLTKRGSGYLRRNIFLAANIARQHDPNFRALYDKKRAEGKPYTVATCAVARKLLTIARAVWLSGQRYELNRW